MNLIPIYCAAQFYSVLCHLLSVIPKGGDPRFGIGEEFRGPIEDTAVSSTNPEPIAAEIDFYSSANAEQPIAAKSAFYCKLCNIYATSQQLLELHFIGAKHKKKMKLQTVIPTKDGNQVDSQFSANRTPSGLFYCSCCDLTVTSDSQLKLHFESKKHNKMLQEKKKAEKK